MGRYLCVMVGGGFGSLTRYLLGRAIVQRLPNMQPFWLGTFAINVTGSFLIGLLMTLLVERWKLSPYVQLALVVGFLGGYTTFSSFEYEGYLSVRGGNYGIALLYLAGSVIAGFGAVFLGAWLASRKYG